MPSKNYTNPGRQEGRSADEAGSALFHSLGILEDQMAIWKLEPTEISSPDWEASAYTKKVFVRAKSEKNAREIVSGAFLNATGVKKWEKIAINPWQSSLVSAVTVQDSNYQDKGNEEIVGPPEALRHINA